MKFELEDGFLLVFISVLPFLTVFTVSSNPDNYVHYVTAREILREPKKLLSGEGFMLTLRQKHLEESLYFYPPLGELLYLLPLALGLQPAFMEALAVLCIGLLFWELDKKALPFFFLSFMSVRLLILGANDLFLLVFTLASLYFFEKRLLVSGVFAGLAPLVKTNGFLILGAWGLSVLLLKLKKETWKKTLLVLVVATLVFTPWYLRNFLLFEGDLLATFTGQNLEQIRSGEEFLETGIQSQQPERNFLDTSGMYPLPVDVLLVLGSLAFLYGLFKKPEVTSENIFLGLFLLVFLVVQLLQIDWLMSWRYFLPIFPLLAVKLSDLLPERHRSLFLGICLTFLVVWTWVTLTTFTYTRSFVRAHDNLCKELKEQVEEPVYLTYWHDWYLLYTCDLKATSLRHSAWVVNISLGYDEYGRRTMLPEVKRTEEVLK